MSGKSKFGLTARVDGSELGAVDKAFAETIKALQNAAFYLRWVSMEMEDWYAEVAAGVLEEQQVFELSAAVATADLLAVQVDMMITLTRKVRKQAKEG